MLRAPAPVCPEVEGKDIEAVRPAGADAMTVEVFARWLHGQVATALGPLPGVTLAGPHRLPHRRGTGPVEMAGQLGVPRRSAMLSTSEEHLRNMEALRT